MELWKHQRQALDFIAHRDSAMLAMEMGTGKSRVVVEICRNLSTPSLVLILCPKAVISVWEREFEKYWQDEDPAAAVLCLGGRKSSQKKYRELRQFLKAPARRVSVVVLNYESAIQKALSAHLVKLQWDLVVLDESHRIKAPGGRTSRFCSRLRDTSHRRLCLTGTPMPHSPLDIYAQFRFLDPEILGSTFSEFKSHYAVLEPRNFGHRTVQVIDGFQNLDDLEEQMAQITFQVRADEVLDLPGKQHEVIPIELEPKSRRIYDELQTEFITELDEGVITAPNALTKLLRLQQITSGLLRPTGHPKGVRVGKEKSEALTTVLQGLPRREPCVVFARFVSDLDAVQDTVAARGIDRPYFELSGRRNELDAWKALSGVWRESQGGLEGNAPVIAVQIQAGGVGVDLTDARFCVYYSLGFSLGDYEQSLARVRRPGQTRRVVYYHLVARDTVDERVYQALAEKRDVVDSVLKALAKRQEVNR